MSVTKDFSESAHALWRCAIEQAERRQEPFGCEHLLTAAASLFGSPAYLQLIVWGVDPTAVIPAVYQGRKPIKNFRPEVLPDEVPPDWKSPVGRLISQAVELEKMMCQPFAKVTDTMILRALLVNQQEYAGMILRRNLGVKEYFAVQKAVA